MGHPEFYPFVISEEIIEKLSFIHKICKKNRVFESTDPALTDKEKQTLDADKKQAASETAILEPIPVQQPTQSQTQGSTQTNESKTNLLSALFGKK